MWAQLLERAAADIARLTPNTPPAVWLPWVGYAATTISALFIAAGTLAITRSRLSSAAVAIAFVATSMLPGDSVGLLLAALTLLGVTSFWNRPPKSLPTWVLPTLLFGGFVFRGHGGWLVWAFAGGGLATIGDYVADMRGPKGPHLRTAWTAWTGSTARAAAIVALTIILITAPRPAASTSTPPAAKPLGHDRVTVNSFRALVSNIPSGSALVDDDPITRILFRAIDTDLRRANVELARIENDAASVRQTLKAPRRVFALPYAQATLAMRGFQILDTLRVADRGLAEVLPGGACVTATNDWQAAPTLTQHRDLAFAAERDDRRGPIVIYLSGDEPIHIDAVDWPSRTLRGFSPRTFDLSNPQDRQDLERQRTEDGGPGTEDPSVRSVTRIALWRMPDAALEMPIHLSAPAAHAAVKLAPESTGDVSDIRQCERRRSTPLSTARPKETSSCTQSNTARAPPSRLSPRARRSRAERHSAAPKGTGAHTQHDRRPSRSSTTLRARTQRREQIDLARPPTTSR